MTNGNAPPPYDVKGEFEKLKKGMRNYDAARQDINLMSLAAMRQAMVNTLGGWDPDQLAGMSDDQALEFGRAYEDSVKSTLTSIRGGHTDHLTDTDVLLYNGVKDMKDYVKDQGSNFNAGNASQNALRSTDGIYQTVAGNSIQGVKSLNPDAVAQYIGSDADKVKSQMDKKPGELYQTLDTLIRAQQ